MISCLFVQHDDHHIGQPPLIQFLLIVLYNSIVRYFEFEYHYFERHFLRWCWYTWEWQQDIFPFLFVAIVFVFVSIIGLLYTMLENLYQHIVGKVEWFPNGLVGLYVRQSHIRDRESLKGFVSRH